MQQTFLVEGMHCSGCVAKVTAALSSVTGVDVVDVRLADRQVHVRADRALPMTELQDALTERGSFKLSRLPPADDGAAARPRAAARGTRVWPLLSMLAAVALFAAAKNFPPEATAHWWHAAMLDYMAGFFLLFGGLKLVNLRRFAAMFAKYDPIAAAVPGWALLYPFIEVALGAAYLMRAALDAANVAVVVLLGIGMVGIWRKLRSKEPLACACLGGVFDVPITGLTVAENAAMVAMAAAMLMSM